MPEAKGRVSQLFDNERLPVGCLHPVSWPVASTPLWGEPFEPLGGEETAPNEKWPEEMQAAAYKLLTGATRKTSVSRN